jgi:hypothetical protein
MQGTWTFPVVQFPLGRWRKKPEKIDKNEIAIFSPRKKMKIESRVFAC